MTDVDTNEAVRALGRNLASLWNGGRGVLDRIVEASGDPQLSPFAASERIGPERLAQLFAEPPAREELFNAFGELTRYLAGETWFDRASAGDAVLATLEQHPIAYFCAEFGLASWLNIYSGGLGILAGDVLKEASDMGLPMVGVGLLYRHGYFVQELDGSEYQQEIPPTLDPAALPLDPATDRDGKPVMVPVPVGDHDVFARVWKLQVGRVPLYLLDTNVPENEQAEDRDITGQLYGGDNSTRIRQELVLGIGGVRALEAIGVEPGVMSLNEGHAAFLAVELLLRALKNSDLTAAQERTRAHVVYTNHTVVPAGNDVFSPDLVRTFVGPYVTSQGLDIDRLLDFGGVASTGGFSMTLLAFQLSGKANAVSELHAQVIPHNWPGYAVEAVTNGVHIPTWLGSEMRALVDRYLPDWRGDNPNWEQLRAIPDEELVAARTRQRHAMIEFVNGVQSRVKLDPDALTLVWARRFTAYKRAWLLASDLGRLSRILADPNRPVQVVFSGKSHPRDVEGKEILQGLLQRLQTDTTVGSRVAFVEDYSERVARYLTEGGDVWLNTPRKPLEASGTSGMKSSDNGGIQLTVTDGWAAEVQWWGIGWGMDGVGDAEDAGQLYQYLETGVVPTFYGRDESGLAREWVSMMKNTLVLTLSRYSTRRMVLDYVRKLYRPLLEEQQVEAGAGA